MCELTNQRRLGIREGVLKETEAFQTGGGDFKPILVKLNYENKHNMAPLKAAYSTNLSVTLCNRTQDSKLCALYTHHQSIHSKSCMWYISVVLPPLQKR